MSEGVAVVGVGQTPYKTRLPDQTLPELAQAAAVAALKDAALTFEDLDAVVFAMAPEALFGVAQAERWAADAVGASGKPLLRVHTGGTTGAAALHAGYLHVASGLAETVLVVGAEKMGESPNAQVALNAIWDPILEKDIALNAINMCSFQAVRHMARYGTTEEQMAAVVVRSRENGLRNPYAHIQRAVTVQEVMESRIVCWPLKLLDCCPRSSGGCAVVLASSRVAGRLPSPSAWITGIGSCTNTYFMGDKMGLDPDNDHGDLDDLAQAAGRAYEMAGISDPASQIDLAEIYAPFSSVEIAAVEALGLCPRGQGGAAAEVGEWDMDGRIPVNPSGGTLCSNPISVTALARAAEAALQVRRAAGARQVPDVHTAVATGVGGSVQFHTVTVFSDRQLGEESSRWTMSRT